MKKTLIALTIVISCLGINKVSANTISISHSTSVEFYCDFYFTDYNDLKEYESNFLELYRLVLEEYNKNYSSEYPYYYVSYSVTDSQNCNHISSANSVNNISIGLWLFKSIPTFNGQVENGHYHSSISASYNVDNSVYTLPFILDDSAYSGGPSLPLFYEVYNPLSYFISNFDLINNTSSTYVITGNSSLTINPGDIIKSYYSSDNVFQNNYTEINLNDYAYVALAPKEFYSDETITTVYVKGQYCLTPVYNYGLRERNDVLSGTKMQRCSVTYEEYTPVRTYLLKQDMQNKAIYYIKAYNTDIENKIKVDNTIFDITYIKEEDKDSPYVYVQGKYYPTIPYDKLTDTATKSEEEGYNSGTSCAVGDLNCQAQYSSSFSDIFNKPLEFLEGIWDSITSVFSLITELLSLLPPIIRDLLYASFALALIIGLIKIIL